MLRPVSAVDLMLPDLAAGALRGAIGQNRMRPGLIFNRQDCLGLRRHLAVVAAPPAPVGAVEARLARFLRLPAARMFPTGTEAIRATLEALLGPQDTVIVDFGAHPATFDAVLRSGAALHRSPAGSLDGLERRLARLGRQARGGRLFVAVPAVSAHGSQIAELAELSRLTQQHGAELIADLSHDLGALGPDGRGVMEIQGCLGRVDILLGTLAPAFGAEAGFAATLDPDRLDRLHPARLPHPATLGAVLAGIDLADSADGRRRRRRLHGLALRLRNRLMADGLRVLGQPSPLVPVLLPPQSAQSRTALLESAGPQVTLLQAPRVAAHAPRWRIELSADHSPADIDDLAELMLDVTRAFDRKPQQARGNRLKAGQPSY